MLLGSGFLNPVVELTHGFPWHDPDLFIRYAAAILAGGVPIIAGLWVASIIMNQVYENRRRNELGRLRKLQRRFGEYNVRPKSRSNGHCGNNSTRTLSREIKKPTRGGRYDRFM